MIVEHNFQLAELMTLLHRGLLTMLCHEVLCTAIGNLTLVTLVLRFKLPAHPEEEVTLFAKTIALCYCNIVTSSRGRQGQIFNGRAWNFMAKHCGRSLMEESC